MISSSYNNNDFGSDNVEAEWTDEFEYYTGVDDAEGEPILEEVDVAPYTNVYEQREYLVQRIRRSFSANMDYRFNANNSIFVKPFIIGETIGKIDLDCRVRYWILRILSCRILP